MGISSCSACLRYSDLVEKLKIRNEELILAIKYPDLYGMKTSKTFEKLKKIPQGHLISQWSSTDSGLDGPTIFSKHDEGIFLYFEFFF